ncbi:MAG TPA: phosphatidylserine decarboxylase [Opitutaceae bacterium]
MPAEPIRYIDRYDGRTKTEKVYGERWLRWAYENPVGRAAVQLLFKRALFSRYYGWRMNRRGSDLRIFRFVEEYGVDISEFAKSPFDFKTFNQFFHRALKPERRPIAPGEMVAVLPADGRHLAFQDVGKADGFYFKGSKFNVSELLGDPALGARFESGSMVISRLCPSDYHRFHFPVGGTPGESKLLPGWLYSVSPIALRRNIRYLVENKRRLTVIEAGVFGTVAMVEIGATNVGSILETFIPGRPAAKGDEKGFFAFGGSCVVTLFEPGRIKLDADLQANTGTFTETYARMGDRLGSLS